MITDLRRALRWMGKNPLFTAAVTVLLALGIGATTAVFSIVDAVLLRPLPYASAERLIRIEETSAQTVMNGIPVSDYLTWRGRTDLFEQTIPFMKDFVTVTGAGGDPDQVASLRTSAGLFSLLGARAERGRPLAGQDGEFSALNATVLSDRFWRRRFHADDSVLGRSMTISGELFTIVGVMPADFEFSSSDIDLWTPLRLTPASAGNVQVLAKLRNGLTVSQVQSAMQIVARQLVEKEPRKKAGLQITVSPWRETVAKEYELTLLFVLAAVGLVLLIACADVGGLLLSRAVQRQKEIAIRASLGAGLWRVMQQLLSEGLLFAVIGSVAGIALAHVAMQFLSKQMMTLPIAIPQLQRVALNERVLLFNAVLCVLLTLILSALPVWLASKTDLLTSLRGGAAAGRSRHSTRMFSWLIASEAAFAFLLLAGSGLMVRSLLQLQQSDHGIRPDHVLTLRVPVGTRTQPPSGPYATRPRQMAYYRELVERLQRIPGVGDVAVVNNLPLSGANTTTAVVGQDGLPLLTATRTISPKYFSVLGIPLVVGRTFSEADQATSPGVAVVNEYLARQLFPGRDPIGQTIPTPDSKAYAVTIVGIVKDTPQNSYDQPVKGEIYRPYQQFLFGAFLSTIVVRTSGDPLALAPVLSKEVWAVDPNQPIVKIETMNDVIADSIWRPRFSAWLASVLGALALLLTSAGVYSVVAYTAALQAREVGIRMALGASPRDVVAVIAGSVMVPLIAGLLVSVAATLLLSRLLTSLLYNIAATDPVAYMGAAVLLLAIGAVASARPAWKAATGDTLRALRTE